MRGDTEHCSAIKGMYTELITGVTQQNISAAGTDEE